MILGGFQKNSLIDYPGKIASVLFTKGCNFTCPYCHNPDLVPFKDHLPLIDNQEVISFLKKRQGFIDAVVITGGEPSLQKNIVEFLKEIKEIGYLIKLDTNGSRPKALKEILNNNLVDLVAMDIKTPFKNYVKITKESDIEKRLEESVEIILGSNTDHLFRTTCAKPFVDIDLMDKLCSHIKGAKKYYIQKFKRERLLEPGFFETIEDFNDDEMESIRDKALAYVDQCKII